jgi:hypothetical protein
MNHKISVIFCHSFCLGCDFETVIHKTSTDLDMSCDKMYVC